MGAAPAKSIRTQSHGCPALGGSALESLPGVNGIQGFGGVAYGFSASSVQTQQFGFSGWSEIELRSAGELHFRFVQFAPA